MFEYLNYCVFYGKIYLDLKGGFAVALQESGEMYLESIFVLTRSGKQIRSIDVCEYMGYSKPSVSRAVGLLKNGGYILVDKDGYLTLTAIGLEVALKIFERHTILTQFLEFLGVDKETACEDACKMEHHISDASFEAIKQHAQKTMITP